MSVKIPFGERDERMFAPMEVANGLACRCSCPACGGALIAYQHGQKRPYFGHHRATACEGAVETALHRMAKQLIGEAEVFDVPAHHVSAKATVGTTTATATVRVCKQGRLIVHDRALEQATPDGTMRPDVRLWGRIEGTEGTCELWIEIAVTHHTEADKIEAMQAQQIRCVEITLDPGMPLVDRETLREALQDGSAYVEWISHPRLPQRQAQAYERARETAAARQQEAEQRAAEKSAEEQQAREAREAAHRKKLEHAITLRQRVLDVLANAQSINLPEFQATARRGRVTAKRSVRTKGPWQIDAIERLPLDGPNTSHIGLHGPEGRLWIVLANSAEPLSSKTTQLEGRGEAAVLIDLTALEHIGAYALDRPYLSRRVLEATQHKRWIDHPAYKGAYEAAVAAIQAETGYAPGKQAPAPRVANRPAIPKTSEEEKRRAIRKWCGMRDDSNQD